MRRFCRITTWRRIVGDSSRSSAQEISNDVIDTFNFAKGKTRRKFPRRSNRARRVGPLTGRANFRSGLLPRRMLDFSSRQPFFRGMLTTSIAALVATCGHVDSFVVPGGRYRLRRCCRLQIWCGYRRVAVRAACHRRITARRLAVLRRC